MRPALGDRVRVTGPMDDPDPMPVGSEGTVDWVGQWTSHYTRQIGVKWDNGRTLLLLAEDPFEIVSPMMPRYTLLTDDEWAALQSLHDPELMGSDPEAGVTYSGDEPLVFAHDVAALLAGRDDAVVPGPAEVRRALAVLGSTRVHDMGYGATWFWPSLQCEAGEE